MRALRVATLNIWNRMGPWEERLPVIRQQLEKLAPDILGLQEVVSYAEIAFDQAALIADGLGYHVAFGVASSAHGVPFGNAVLSRWPILRSVVTPLPNVGTDERRSLLFCEIDAPFAKVPFFVTHLNWKLHEGFVRRVQVRAVADRVADLAPIAGFPPILVGDFNAEPESDEIRFLRGLTIIDGKSVYFADAFGVAGVGPSATYTKENAFAAPLREPDRRIDYVFVRGPDAGGRGAPLEARRCFDEPQDGTFASDHFGAVATLTA